MATKTILKKKGHRTHKAKYHILFYSAAFFEPGKETEEEQAKNVRLPIKIAEDEGETRSNITHFEIKSISHFDAKVEEVLVSLSNLQTKVIKPQRIEDKKEETKLTFKMLSLICTGTASQTLQEAFKTGR